MFTNVGTATTLWECQPALASPTGVALGMFTRMLASPTGIALGIFTKILASPTGVALGMFTKMLASPTLTDKLLTVANVTSGETLHCGRFETLHCGRFETLHCGRFHALRQASRRNDSSTPTRPSRCLWLVNLPTFYQKSCFRLRTLCFCSHSAPLSFKKLTN
jgi:hypothetical protein